MKKRDTYFDDLTESKSTLRSAKAKGQTFNDLIRQFNDNVLDPENTVRTLLDDIPSVFAGFSGDVHLGTFCTVCHRVNCVPVEHRFMCVPCWKAAGELTQMAGNDNWIYDLGLSEFSDPDDSPEFDEETLILLDNLDVDIDLDIALALKPPY